MKQNKARQGRKKLNRRTLKKIHSKARQTKVKKKKISIKDKIGINKNIKRQNKMI